MRLTTVRVPRWLVIGHCLSHAVLPLRGSLAPAFENSDWMPAALDIIAMIGLVAAGLGMLGLRPLDAAVSPVLVPASGLSLVAIVRFGDPTLWMGGALDMISSSSVFYNYDWLERAFGADVHNAGVIRNDWQRRQVGDLVRATNRTISAGCSDTTSAGRSRRSRPSARWSSITGARSCCNRSRTTGPDSSFVRR
jgi:hypothetical protein